LDEKLFSTTLAPLKKLPKAKEKCFLEFIRISLQYGKDYQMYPPLSPLNNPNTISATIGNGKNQNPTQDSSIWGHCP
jgi:hypothetical protein